MGDRTSFLNLGCSGKLRICAAKSEAPPSSISPERRLEHPNLDVCCKIHCRHAKIKIWPPCFGARCSQNRGSCLSRRNRSADICLGCRRRPRRPTAKFHQRTPIEMKGLYSGDVPYPLYSTFRHAQSPALILSSTNRRPQPKASGSSQETRQAESIPQRLVEQSNFFDAFRSLPRFSSDSHPEGGGTLSKESTHGDGFLQSLVEMCRPVSSTARAGCCGMGEGARFVEPRFEEVSFAQPRASHPVPHLCNVNFGHARWNSPGPVCFI